MDDFGVKYVGKEHADHLVNTLKNKYQISEDWQGALYCGISLNWNYEGKTYVDTHLPNYVSKKLAKFGHTKPNICQHIPLQPLPRTYGKSAQIPNPPDDTPLLEKNGIKRVQQVSGSFLYYGRAVDSLILHALSDIASEQSAPS